MSAAADEAEDDVRFELPEVRDDEVDQSLSSPLSEPSSDESSTSEIRSFVGEYGVEERGVRGGRVLEEGNSLYRGSFGRLASRERRKPRDRNPIIPCIGETVLCWVVIKECQLSAIAGFCMLLPYQDTE
jgi:hypothetical protein